MKVLHVYKSYFPTEITGVPRVIWHLAEGTRRHGVDAKVLSTAATTIRTGAVGQHEAHYARRHFQLASTDISLSMISLFRHLSREADIVHYHFPWPVLDLLHHLAHPRRPTLLTYHSDVVRQQVALPLYRPLMNRFLKSVDRIVATSTNYLNSSQVLSRFANKASVIPIGIAERHAPTAGCLENWRSKVGESFFLFVGTARYYKGLEFLLKAAEIAGKPVVLVGKGTNELSLRRLAPINVRLLGEVGEEDREALLTLSRAFILPSHLRSEAFGVALLEAARAGKPMISCEVGSGSSYVNEHERTGLVVRPAQPDELARAMVRLDEDAQLASHWGKAARARFEQLFRAEDMCRRYVELYEGLVAGARREA